MKPFSIGQKVKIIRGSVDKSIQINDKGEEEIIVHGLIDKTIYIIESCSWRPDQTEPDPIPIKDHWKDKNGKPTFEPLPMPCPSYTLDKFGLDGRKTAMYHFELKAVDE